MARWTVRRGSNVMPGTAKYGAGDQMGVRASLLWKFTPHCAVPFIADYFSTGRRHATWRLNRNGRELRSALFGHAGHLTSRFCLQGKLNYKPTTR